MNKKSLVLLTFAGVIVVGVLTWLGINGWGLGYEEEDYVVKGPSVWEGEVFPERLQVADIDLPLVFEEPVSEELKQVILADLHLIYGHMTGHKPYHPQSPRRILIGSEALLAKTVIQITGPGRFRPDEFEDLFAAVVQIDGQDHIAIPQELIEAYEAAWERKKANPVIYGKLEGFVNLMSDVFEGKAVPSDLPPKMKDVFHPANREMAKEFKKGGGTGSKGILKANLLGPGSVWRMPSLLEIKIDDTGLFFSKGGDPVFWCPFYYFGQDGRLKHGGEIIYIDTRWKMLVPGASV